uniref:DUF7164 domain-containing protein n=1 Tax=Clytia hemisphaerica TaxID=252671 RepID=A0A7M5U6Q6_9CNID
MPRLNTRDLLKIVFVVFATKVTYHLVFYSNAEPKVLTNRRDTVVAVIEEEQRVQISLPKKKKMKESIKQNFKNPNEQKLMLSTTKKVNVKMAKTPKASITTTTTTTTTTKTTTKTTTTPKASTTTTTTPKVSTTTTTTTTKIPKTTKSPTTKKLPTATTTKTPTTNDPTTSRDYLGAILYIPNSESHARQFLAFAYASWRHITDKEEKLLDKNIPEKSRNSIDLLAFCHPTICPHLEQFCTKITNISKVHNAVKQKCWAVEQPFETDIRYGPLNSFIMFK